MKSLLLPGAASAALLFTPAFNVHAGLIDLEELPPTSGLHDEDWRPAGGFATGGAFFNNLYDPTFGTWAGFALSLETNNTTPGFGNQYSAWPGSGAAGGSKYAVGFLDTFTPFLPVITLPSGELPLSIRVTNTTYAALSMRDGDPFAKKFGGPTGDDPDWFKLTISGFDAGDSPSGNVEFYLADFRSANNTLDYIVNRWALVDLISLEADTRKLQFSLSSSDNGAFGMNTPAYFAVDHVQTTVPEPGIALLLAPAAAGLALRRRRA